jgi:hypothetical protein
MKPLVAEKVREVVFPSDMGTNTPNEVLLAQVTQNIRRGLPQVSPHQPNPATALLVCGGPSLAMTERELVEAYWKGGKVCAVNGAYQWCIERNIKPSLAIMLDAREFNARFVEADVPGCRYLLASQCHPKTFEVCRDRDVLIWHACSAGDAEVDLICDYYFQARDEQGRLTGRQTTYPVTLGTTVSVRAISLLRMLGLHWFDIFGLDSCWLDNRHHAYEQPENNRDGRMGVWLRPKDRDDKSVRFECAPWHMKQAQDFMALIRERGNQFQINVRGPGLIATILRTGAEIETETTEKVS